MFGNNKYFCLKLLGKKYPGRLIGASLIDEWEKAEVEVRFEGELGHVEPDIMDFGGLTGVVLTSKAREILEDLILPFGELLPLEMGSSLVYLINPTMVLDCVDEDKSEMEIVSPLNRKKITKYVFKEIEYPPIFRLKNELLNYIVNEEFVKRLKENNLEGYKIRELWDSNS